MGIPGSNRRVRIGKFEGELEAATCPICVNPERPRCLYQTSEGIGYHLCSSCNLMYASPRFTEASSLEIYENPAFFALSFHPEWDYESWKRANSRAYRQTRLKVELVRRYLAPGQRFFDMGCGAGLAVVEAERQGLVSEGLDPSRMLTRIARQRIGATVHTGKIADFYPSHQYDGVMAWDVLEHLNDPLEVLRRCRKMLVPSGYLFAQVPNHLGLSNRFKAFLSKIRVRPGFTHFGFPWHVYSFDRKSLTRLIEAAGLKCLLVESWPRTVKDEKDRFLYVPINRMFRSRCWGDYIVVVARNSTATATPTATSSGS